MIDPSGVATSVAGIMSSSRGQLTCFETCAFHSRSGCTANKESDWMKTACLKLWPSAPEAYWMTAATWKTRR